MGRAILFVAIGLVLLGSAGLLLFPNVRTDILSRIPFLGGGGNRQITLTYWGVWEPREVVQPLIDEYQQQHQNITIEYEMRDPKSHYETLASRLGGEGSPDIIRAHSTWIPFLQDKLLPLPKDVMSNQDYEGAFFPVNQTFVKISDSYYGIPLMVDGLALVYNRSLFLEEGVANPPKTWNELRDISARLTKKNSSNQLVQSGVALGYADNIDYFSDILGLMFAQNGVQFTDAEGNVTFHNSLSPIGSNLAVEALTFYSLFATTEKSWDRTWNNSTEEFTKGRVAMILIPNHRIHEVLSSSPTFEIGVAQAPQLPSVGSQSQPVNWANYWVESVGRASANGKEAWKFLKWLSEKDQLTKLYRLEGQIRAFGEPYPRPDLTSSLSAETYTLPYAQQGPTYRTWLFAGGTFNPVINDRIVAILARAVEDVADGKSDPNAAIPFAGSQVQKVLTDAAAAQQK